MGGVIPVDDIIDHYGQADIRIKEVITELLADSKEIHYVIAIANNKEDKCRFLMNSNPVSTHGILATELIEFTKSYGRIWLDNLMKDVVENI